MKTIRYKLKQDVLWYKAGTIFERDDEERTYITEPGHKRMETLDTLQNAIASYMEDEDNREYFEEVSTLPSDKEDYTVCELCGRKTGHSKDCPINAKEVPNKEEKKECKSSWKIGCPFCGAKKGEYHKSNCPPSPSLLKFEEIEEPDLESFSDSHRWIASLVILLIRNQKKIIDTLNKLIIK